MNTSMRLGRWRGVNEELKGYLKLPSDHKHWRVASCDYLEAHRDGAVAQGGQARYTFRVKYAIESCTDKCLVALCGLAH